MQSSSSLDRARIETRTMKPNWRNADDYPRPADATPAEWAWEFLRRNTEYVEDWRAFKERIGEYADRYPNLNGQEMARFLMDERYQYVIETGTLSREEWLAGKRGTYSKTEISLANWYGRKWGLVRIADPEASYNHATHTWSDKAGALKFPASGFDFGDPRYMAVAIDLALPIKDQLEQVRTHYERLRKNRMDRGLIKPTAEKQKRFDDYPGYLRALDAWREGVKEPEIASVLLPHVDDSYANGHLGRKSICNWLKASTRLVEKEYRALPLIPRK